MSPKDHNDWRKTDRAKDKIKKQKKPKPQKKHWSEWAGDNPAHPDDSVDMTQQEWDEFLERSKNEKDS